MSWGRGGELRALPDAITGTQRAAGEVRAALIQRRMKPGGKEATRCAYVWLCFPIYVCSRAELWFFLIGKENLLERAVQLHLIPGMMAGEALHSPNLAIVMETSFLSWHWVNPRTAEKAHTWNATPGSKTQQYSGTAHLRIQNPRQCHQHTSSAAGCWVGATCPVSLSYKDLLYHVQ